MVLRASSLVILIGLPALAAAAEAPAASASPAGGAQHLIAVVEVPTDDSVRIPGKVQLVDLVRQQVRGHAGYDAASKEEVKAAIAVHDKEHPGCTQHSECLSAVARDLSAEAVVAGTLTKAGGSYAVMLWIVGAKPTPTTHIASGVVPDVKGLWPQIQTSLDKLYSWGAPDPALMARPEPKPVIPPKVKPAPPPPPVVVAKPPQPEPEPEPEAPPPPVVARHEEPKPAPEPPPPAVKPEEPKPPPPAVAKHEEPEPPPPAENPEEPKRPPPTVAKHEEPKPPPEAPPAPPPEVVKHEEPPAPAAAPVAPAAAPASASGAVSPADIRTQLMRRVKYDSDYFSGVQEFAASGKTNPKLPPEEFAKDVARAKAVLPVLTGFVAEQEKYAGGEPFTLPPAGEVFHVYRNDFLMLNAVQAYERGDDAATILTGGKVVARPHDRIGLARGAGTAYSPNIYQDFAALIDAARRRIRGEAPAAAVVVPAPVAKAEALPPPVAAVEPPPPPVAKEEPPPPPLAKEEPPPAPPPVVKQEAPPAPPPTVVKEEARPAEAPPPPPPAEAKEAPKPAPEEPPPPLPPVEAKEEAKPSPQPLPVAVKPEEPRPTPKAMADLPPLPPIESIAPDRFETAPEPAAHALAPPAAPAPLGVPGAMAPEEICAQLLRRTNHDATYFQGIQEFVAAGKTNPKLSADDFAKDVARAKIVMPVLSVFLSEQDKYAAGQPFTLPPPGNAFRVYTNVLSMLNALQAYQRSQFAAAVEAGGVVVAKKNERIGLARGAGTSYSPNIFRDFFTLMADARQRAVNAAANPPPLVAATPDAKAHPRPIAILPFATAGGGKPDAWMRAGLPEVIAGDLLDHTDIPVVDRLDVEPMASSRSPQEIGKATQAGAVIVGSAIADRDHWSIYLQVVDTDSGQPRASAAGIATSDKVVTTARELAVKALSNSALLSDDAAVEIVASRPPSLQTVKDLGFVRVMLGNKVGDTEAKRLFANATHADPVYANLFTELKARYPGVRATVAVGPIAGATPSDGWMAVGVDHVLSAALAGAGFDVVDRARFRSAIPHAPGELFSPDDVRVAGEQVHADVVILGDITHEAPDIRLAARAVDVKTGAVFFTAFVVEPHDDLGAAAAALGVAVARRFNAPLPDKAGEQLSAGLPARPELDARARQDAVESAVWAATHTTTARPLPWIGVSAAVAGAAAATAFLVVSSQRMGYASYYAAQAAGSPSTVERTHYNSESSAQLQAGTGLEVAGFVSLAIAATGIGLVTFDLVRGPPRVAVQPKLGAAQGPAPTPSLTENIHGPTAP